MEHPEVKSLNIKVIGWVVFISGFVAILSSISLISSYITANPIITRFSFSLGVLNFILIVPLLIFLSTFVLNKQRILARIFQSLVFLGALVLIKARIQLVTGVEINTVFTDETVLWEYLGVSLIGLAVLTYVLVKPPNPGLMIGHVWFRVVFGVALSSYISGLIFRGDIDQFVGGHIGITEVNPIVTLLFFTMSLIYVVGRPIWMLWVGRILLKKPGVN